MKSKRRIKNLKNFGYIHISLDCNFHSWFLLNYIFSLHVNHLNLRKNGNNNLHEKSLEISKKLFHIYKKIIN